MQEAYKKFVHVLNDVSWCGVLFFSSNSPEKAKEVLKDFLYKDAQEAVKLLSSIPSEEIKSFFEDDSYLSKRSSELVLQTKHIIDSKSFIEQTSSEEQALMQDIFNNIKQIHSIFTK